MKKMIPFLAAIVLLAGCGNNSNPTSANPSDNTNLSGNGGSNAPETTAPGTNGMGNGSPTAPQKPGP